MDGSPPPAVLVPRRVPTFPFFCLHVTYTPPPLLFPGSDPYLLSSISARPSMSICLCGFCVAHPRLFSNEETRSYLCTLPDMRKNGFVRKISYTQLTKNYTLIWKLNLFRDTEPYLRRIERIVYHCVLYAASPSRPSSRPSQMSGKRVWAAASLWVLFSLSCAGCVGGGGGRGGGGGENEKEVGCLVGTLKWVVGLTRHEGTRWRLWRRRRSTGEDG